MSGETDLHLLLASLTPVRQPGTFAFVTAPEVPSDVVVHAMVSEPEGRTFVVSVQDAERIGISADYLAAWIRLDVHSALDAVGLTAAVSHALADHGISCNVIAGYFHDHLLVPADRAEDAIAALEDLARSHR